MDSLHRWCGSSDSGRYGDGRVGPSPLDGQGQLIDAGQMEMSLQFLAPQIIDFNLSGRLVTRNGNRSDTAAPHGAYPCAGEDQWCAIAVESDEQWTGLKKAMGNPDWAEDRRFDTTIDRLQHQTK